MSRRRRGLSLTGLDGAEIRGSFGGGALFHWCLDVHLHCRRCGAGPGPSHALAEGSGTVALEGSGQVSFGSFLCVCCCDSRE